MSIFAISLAFASITAAHPREGANWVRADDYPADIFREKRGGYVGFSLSVSAEGKPMRCDITDSTGYKDLDALTCQLIMQRARFDEPARDSSGAPSAGVYRSSVMWWTDGVKMNARPVPFDLSLTVQHLPDGIASPSTATVALAVDTAGKISDCVPILPQPSARPGSKQADAEQRVVDLLGKIACAYTRSQFTPKPATDALGNLLASIQTAKVLFTKESGAH